ncbi:unnamed protein product [Brugia timori]|uniref:Sushi domain-containing protein n=1 Tax=Brugia timori TaxID=42155 RepID=A0A3P7WJY0_9BILA|nr:unnamed protein product [Brugia timori]
MHASFTDEIFPISILSNHFEIVLSTESKPVLSIIGFNLQYANKTTISMEEQGILSCAQNPLEIAIPYTLVDRLSNVKAIHLHVSNASRIIVTAVILQSSKMFNLLALQNCAVENKYFDPVSASCAAKDCRSLSIGSRTPLNIPRSWVRFYFVFLILSINLFCLSFHHHCHGTMCTYTCEAGFMFENSQKTVTVQCLNSHWIGNMNLACQTTQYVLPKIEQADVNCPNGTNYRDRCIFRCRNNAIMIGQINYIICEENGLWTLPKAFCQIVCSQEGLLALNISYDSINCKVKHFLPVSIVCRLNCFRQYRASQMQTLHTKIRLVCSDDGVWIGPSCIPVTCPSPKIVYIGSYNCTNGFEIGPSYRFQCPGIAQVNFFLFPDLCFSYSLRLAKIADSITDGIKMLFVNRSTFSIHRNSKISSTYCGSVL